MSDTQRRIYEFGPFRVDALRRILLREGNQIRLPAKAFEILLVLLEEKGRLVEKDELMRRVWPDAVVEENNLTVNISALRRSLTESPGEHRYVVTLPGRGYQFVADVRQLGGEQALESEPDALAYLGVAEINSARATAYSEAKLTSRSNGSGVGSGRAQVSAELTNGVTNHTPTQSSAEYIGGEIKRHKNGVPFLLALLATTIVVSYLAYSRYIAGRDKPGITSIAVLPFANNTGDPNAEYLSDGVSESLINSLSQLPGVKVIARSSAFKYKGTEVDLKEVAKVLGVEAILTGRVIQHGDNLSISVELVNANDKTQIWGEQYHRRAVDLQSVQAEVARTVSEKLRVRLTGTQEQQLSKRATENAQAYQLYLTGVFNQRKQNLDGYKKALEYFDQAVALDPNFAIAFASMPAVYANLAGTSGLDAKEAIAKGKAAAQKALQLDATLAEAHSGMAAILRHEWDWSGAESEYKRAIELNPNLAGVYSGYSLYLAGMGRTAEALAENKRAQEIDPLRITFKGNEGSILNAARRYDEALQVYQNVIRMQPDYPFGHVGLAHTYAAKGMYEEAIKEYQTGISLYGEVTNGLIDLGYAYAMSGKRDEALAIRNKLKTSKERVSPAGLAILYAGLGEKEAAFQALERAYSTHDSQLESLGIDPRYDSLRSDPRFQDLLRRMRLPP